MKILIWLILSLVSIAIFKAYSILPDKSIEAVGIMGLYGLIAVLTFAKLASELDFKSYGKYSIMSYYFPLTILAIPFSILFVDRFPNLPSYLIIQLIVILIISLCIELYKKSMGKK